MWLRYVPSARWPAGYRIGWLAGDIVAGITLAAYAIPVSLAYAALAGLPPQVGIYGYLLGGLGYALFGSSRHLAVGPTSAISLMIAGTVGAMAEGDAQRYAQIATLAGFTVAILCLDRMVAATEHAGAADKRQHFGRLQGRCRIDDHHDAAAKPVWRYRRWTQLLRASGGVGRPTRPNRTSLYLRLALQPSCCSCWAIAFCRDGRSLLPL